MQEQNKYQALADLLLDREAERIGLEEIRQSELGANKDLQKEYERWN